MEYISGSRRLTEQDIVFEDDITVENAIDGHKCLNFYMATWFDVDEVFGTNVNTDDNDDCLNAYANYSIEGRCVMDSLDICVNHSEGNVTELKYRLDDVEKALILKAMESYSMIREGLTLDRFIEQLDAENDEAPVTENTLKHN